ncbi:MAG: O-antigen ligase family protein [Coriobacteriia bacterium]|nr:O-antigen ligase family protein [Coriobacteriia bacterium]
MGSSRKKAARRKAAGKGTQASSAAGKGGRPRGGAPSRPVSAEMDAGHRVAWACLHVLLVAVPLAMSNATWTGVWRLPLTYDQFDIVKVFVMRAVTLVAYGALGWSILIRGGKVRRTPADWLVLAFLAWVVLTTVLSIHPPTAVFGKYRRFEGLISFVNYAAVFFLAVQFVDRPSRIRSLARTAFLGAVLVAGYGATQVLGIDPVDWGRTLPFEARRAFSTYGNPDLLGGYLVLVLPLGLALALEERQRWWRAAYWAGFLLVVFTWITAIVRGAWIGGIVALAILGFAAFRRRTRLQALDYAFIVAVVLMGAVIVYQSLDSPSHVMNIAKRFSTILDFSRGSGLTRTQIWQAAVEAVRDRPLTGFGADTFRLLFPKYKPVEYVAAAGYLSVADNVHNYPLQAMTAFGVPGFLLLYGVFGLSAFKSAPVAFSREDAGERFLLAAMWAGCAGYLVHLLAGLSVTGSTFLLWAFMGILLAPVARNVELKAPSWGSYAGIALAGVVLAASMGNAVYVAADNQYLRARLSGMGQDRVAASRRAIALNPYNDMYRAELGQALQSEFIDRLREARAAEQAGQDAQSYTDAAVRALGEAEAAMADTIEYVPWEYDNYVFLANLYNLAADFGFGREYAEKAVRAAERGVEVEPFGPAIRLQLAVAYRTLDRDDDAIAELETAVGMDPRYTDGNLMLGDMYRDRGRDAEAAEAYRRVIAVTSAPAATRETARNSLLSVEGTTGTPGVK